MEPEASTSKAATPDVDVDGPIVSTSGGGYLPALQQQVEELFFINHPASVKQCHQLFATTCRVNVSLQRCKEISPAPNNPGTSAKNPTDDELRTAVKVDADSDSTGSSSSSSSEEEDDEIKIIATFPPSGTSTKRGPVPKKKGKRVFKTASCTVCKKTMSSKNSLKRHLRKHTGEKRYKCDHCEKRFWNPSTFSNHKKARSNLNGVCPRVYPGGWRPKGSWTCKTCGKRMKQPSYYLRHMEIHRKDEKKSIN